MTIPDTATKSPGLAFELNKSHQDKIENLIEKLKKATWFIEKIEMEQSQDETLRVTIMATVGWAFLKYLDNDEQRISFQRAADKTIIQDQELTKRVEGYRNVTSITKGNTSDGDSIAEIRESLRAWLEVREVLRQLFSLAK